MPRGERRGQKSKFNAWVLFENIAWLGRKEMQRSFERVDNGADVIDDRIDRVNAQVKLNREIVDVDLSRIKRTLDGYDIAITAIQHPISIYEPHLSRFEAVEAIARRVSREQIEQLKAIAKQGTDVLSLQRELAAARAEIATMQKRIDAVGPAAVQAARNAAEEHLNLIEADADRQGDMLAGAQRLTAAHAREIDRHLHG